uniref:Uncharacterized protein n=1 Tax=Timema bartmani TaxID=61472 RepID=A0A7R9F274_9NEOP|nr:unnamed protein product [Timema bartmani]
MSYDVEVVNVLGLMFAAISSTASYSNKCFTHFILGAPFEHYYGVSQMDSLFVKQALEGEYPKFLRLYLDLCKRLQALSNQSNGQSEVKMIRSTGSTTTETSVFQINREVVVEFENAYLSRSVSRLLDPVHLMFSGETVPTHEEVDSLIRTITSELSVSLVDVSLSRIVARNISKTVRLFCLKCEQMIVTSGEATQVIDSPTPGQILNVSIGNLLHYLNCQVMRVISNMKTSLQQDTSSIVMESLSNTESLTTGIVSTLLASISDGIEAIILTMHNEDYSISVQIRKFTAARKQLARGKQVARVSTSGDLSANLDPKRIDVSCSLYMKELQSFVSRAVSILRNKSTSLKDLKNNTIYTMGFPRRRGGDSHALTVLVGDLFARCWSNVSFFDERQAMN